MLRALSLFLCLSLALPAIAQQKLQRVGVVHVGGAYEAMVQGLRIGLRDLRVEEGKEVVLHVRNTRGNLGEVEAAVKQLVSERVDLLFTVTTSVSVRAKKATRDIPIVFYAGNDPVRSGLVESFAKPGGRVTGIHHVTTPITDKRLQILRQALPKARRVVAFYDPDNAIAREGMALMRSTAPKLKLELLERPVSSVQELTAGVRALRPGDADAYLGGGDAMVTSGTPLIVDLARERRLPLVVSDLRGVEDGALIAYGASYLDLGRAAAKYVQRVLAGAKPADLPVETYEKVQLALNLRIAHELGVTVPQDMILRADRVIR